MFEYDNDDRIIYARLNEREKEVEYKGGQTNTANVNIRNKVISVDVKLPIDAMQKRQGELQAKQIELTDAIKSLKTSINLLDSNSNNSIGVVSNLEEQIRQFGEQINTTTETLNNIQERLTTLERLIEQSNNNEEQGD